MGGVCGESAGVEAGVVASPSATSLVIGLLFVSFPFFTGRLAMFLRCSPFLISSLGIGISSGCSSLSRAVQYWA